MSVLVLTAALLAAAPAHAQNADDDAATEVTYALPDLDIVVRVPLEDPTQVWRPPSWALVSESSLALQPDGQQIIAMFEQVQREFQPRLDPEISIPRGPTMGDEFIDDVYAGPELGEVTWGEFELVRSPNLGEYLRGTAVVDLPDREDENGRLVVSFYPVRGGLNATVIVGVAEPEAIIAADDTLASMTAFFAGPVPTKDLPTGHVVDGAGYELDLPADWRALTERERTAIKGEPVGGNSGYGGALAHQWYFDPASPGGHEGFGCVAYSADTMEIVSPDKAPRLGNNYRLAASLILRGGSYKVDGGKPIRGRPADLLDSRHVVVDPTVEGDLQTIKIGDREAYLWSTTGKRISASGEEEAVTVGTFYTAYDDVNLHCQAVANGEHPDLLSTFQDTMRTLRVTDGAQHPLELGLMARYKQWWPYKNAALQLYWLPIPIILFAAWLANRGD